MELRFRSGHVVAIPYEVFIDPALILDEVTETYRIAITSIDNDLSDVRSSIDLNIKDGWLCEAVFSNESYELEIMLASADKIVRDNVTIYEFDMCLDGGCIYRRKGTNEKPKSKKIKRKR